MSSAASLDEDLGSIWICSPAYHCALSILLLKRMLYPFIDWMTVHLLPAQAMVVMQPYAHSDVGHILMR